MAENTDIDALIEQCRSGDDDARRSAIFALRDAEAGRAAPVIVPLLSSEDVGVRSAAAHALGYLGDDYLDVVGPALVAALDDPDEGVRNDATEALGALEYTPARPALERVLLHDDYWVARASAAEALEYVGDARALDALEAAIDDDAESVRSYVVTAIERLGGASSLPAIQRRLAIETHPQPRSDLIAAALRFGDESAFDHLLSLSAEVDCEEFVYHVLRVVAELLDGPTPDVVLRRAAELEPHLMDLPRRAGRLAEWAGDVRAKLVTKAGTTDDAK